MRSQIFRSRFLLCVIFLALNIAIQFLLLSFAGLWAPLSDSSVVSTRNCECPKSDQSEEVVMCAAPPASDDPLKDSTHHLLFVLVLTGVSGQGRRAVARETWMHGYKDSVHSVLIRFAIGTQGLLPEEVESLKTEQDTYGDLLLLPNLQESYQNLTLKVLHSFTRIIQQFKFSYVLKCDDDSFLLLDTILSELSKREDLRSLYWGFFDGRAHIKTKGKWTEKDWFLCDRYLPYALGGGYVLSHDLVLRIANAADGLELYNSEDVSVGVWLSPYKAERKHDTRFNTEFVSRGCRNVYIVSHKQSAEDMRSKFKNLQETGNQCEKEYQTRLSYEYNWNHPPTQCCERREGIP